MVPGVIDSPNEAAEGVWQSILEVEGILQPVDRVASNFEGGLDGKEPKDRAKITLNDAVITIMRPGVPAPELKDAQFTTYLPYAEPGKLEPSKQSIFVRGFLHSAVTLDAARKGADYKKLPEEEKKKYKLSGLHGTRIRLVRGEVKYTVKDKASGEKAETGYPTYLVAEVSGSKAADIKEHIKLLVAGKNESFALRALLSDSRAKGYPEYKETLRNDPVKFAETFGLALVDGVFRDATVQPSLPEPPSAAEVAA